MSLFYKKSW